MDKKLVSFEWLETRADLPGRLEIDRLYFIAADGVTVIDHGSGPVEFGGGGGGDGLYRGAYEDAAALRAAHPADVLGAYATVLDTGTVWIWGGLDWTDTGHASAEIEIVDNLTTAAGDKALSARQGVVLDEKITELNGNITELDGNITELDGKIADTASAVTLSMSIAPEAWTEDVNDATGYPWHADIANKVISGGMTAFVSFARASMTAAITAGVCAVAETADGAVRLWAAHAPAVALTGMLTLLLPNGEILVDDDFATDGEVDDAIGPIWGNP